MNESRIPHFWNFLGGGPEVAVLLHDLWGEWRSVGGAAPGHVRDDNAGGGCLAAEVGRARKHAIQEESVLQKAVPRISHAFMAQKPRSSLTDNDIHRLVRVTAHKRLVQGDRL